MSRAQSISLGVTAALAIALFIWLRLSYIHFSAPVKEWPPRNESEVILAEENMFDVISDVAMPVPTPSDPSPVHNETAENNASSPAPASGDAVRNAGKAAEAPVTATSTRPSPVKTVPSQPAPSGPSQEEIEAEEARRKANAAMTSAFARADGNNNTANRGTEEGNSGSPSATASGVNGVGTGTVGGGWSLPSYAKVPSTLTGSISLMVKINREGRVTSVTFQGGDAPAATDARLRRAVENEVKSRRFTRGNTPAPEQATAYITYRFR